ncbi:MAG: UDP-N-acetylglucosamine 2-epimerase (non-hydrolyzing) [Inhella sp.]|nr:UDP-N-acetylglucosamine 2-epimerase (non-hydrolyzing) [Inhella sp.]
MNKPKIVTVIGARPQFVKASVVSHALARHGGLEEVLVHTGQHFDANMSEVFFDELGMAPPAHRLAIHGGRHGAMTGQMLAAVEQVLVDEAPAAVLVYGDTNSTLAGALAAVKLHVPVAHVEAGLRSFNLAMPEEVNRILTDRISRWLFTPTAAAEAHLAAEGVPRERIVPVGDVMFDVALHHGARASEKGGVVTALGLARGGYALATVHRAENTDNPARLAVIVAALCELAATLPVVWPLHPRTRGVLQATGALASAPAGLRLVDPVGYLDMVRLERDAALIATDSGGVQKEAFFHRVPCVTLRDETEWVELVDAGWNRLAPPHEASVVAAALHAAIGVQGRDAQPYGRGDAAQRIVQRLAADLGA